jgi:hypothetical protein
MRTNWIEHAASVLTFSDSANSDEKSSWWLAGGAWKQHQCTQELDRLTTLCSNTCMCMRCEQGSSQPKKTIPIEASDVACSHLQPLKKVQEKEVGVAIQCVRPSDLHQTITRVNGELATERSPYEQSGLVQCPIYVLGRSSCTNYTTSTNSGCSWS